MLMALDPHFLMKYSNGDSRTAEIAIIACKLGQSWKGVFVKNNDTQLDIYEARCSSLNSLDNSEDYTIGCGSC